MRGPRRWRGRPHDGGREGPRDGVRGEGPHDGVRGGLPRRRAGGWTTAYGGWPCRLSSPESLIHLIHLIHLTHLIHPVFFRPVPPYADVKEFVFNIGVFFAYGT
jgi:hypothetical protein